MFIDENAWEKLTTTEILQVQRLSAAMKASWSVDTAYPDDAHRWKADNPAVGQCAVTALVVQHFLGGKILRNRELHHYWNQLPSGAVVDFTREQFGTDRPIPSDGEASRAELLRGARAHAALTPTRYSSLKDHVAKVMKKSKSSVFLFSSNARKEYIVDILETLGLPDGESQHFRYKLQHVHKALRHLVPNRGAKKNPLRGMNAIVFYLKQKRIGSTYEWVESLPIRCAIIRDCYKTGDDPGDVVHFFFEVQSGLRVASDGYQQAICSVMGDEFGKAYAFLTSEPTGGLGTPEEANTSFEAECQALAKIGFDCEEDGIQVTDYEPPLLVKLEGLYRRRHQALSYLGVKDKVVVPRYDRQLLSSHYCLNEGKSYCYRFRTQRLGSAPHKVELEVSVSLFANQSKYELTINSPYDSGHWELIPSFVKQRTIGETVFSIIRNEDPAKHKDELNWRIRTGVRIVRMWWLRVMDIVADFLFLLGPVLLTVTKLYDDKATPPAWVTNWPMIKTIIENWPIALAFIYVLWLIVKIWRKAISEA